MTGPAGPAVTVVMPAHDEAEILAESVGAVVAGLRARSLAAEVVVVENGSRDGTAGLAHELAAAHPEVRVESLVRADYGDALRTGVLGARAPVVVCYDVDLYDLTFADRARALLAQPGGPAIVVGSKLAPGADDRRPWVRRAVTVVFSRVLRAAFGLTLTDTHGMKAMRLEAVRPHAERCHRGSDLFDTELVLRVERAGLGVAELPVAVAERRPPRTSLLRRGVRTLGGLVRLRIALWREARTGP